MSGIATRPIPNSPQFNAPLQLETKAYLIDGAIDLISGIAALTKATAGAYTLANPPADGLVLFITSTTAAAHVITNATSGFNGKGSSGTITWAGATGDGVTLVSYNGLWYTASEHNITVA